MNMSSTAGEKLSILRSRKWRD